MGEFQMTGSSWVMSNRLSAWLGCEKGGIDAIIAVLNIHPAFQPRQYWGINLTLVDEARALLELQDCPALRETLPYGWQTLLAHGLDGGLEGMVKGVDPRARVVRVAGDTLSWEIVLDGDEGACEEPLAVQVAKGTVLYQTQLKDHIQLLQV